MKCPTFNQRLMAWYNSAEFLAKSEESRPLRAYIASIVPGYGAFATLDTSLENFWNVYDMFSVWRSYGASTCRCRSIAVRRPVACFTDWQRSLSCLLVGVHC